MSTPVLCDFLPPPRTGNVVLLMHEVRHALDRLVRTGEATTIDLSTLPMTAPEHAELDTALGSGEVSAMLDASGPSEVRETAFPGVWRVTHRSEEGLTLGRYIEIVPIPEILLAQPRDIAAGLARLSHQLTPSPEQEVTS
ncbi:MAG: hypothetical protein KDF54_08850 [Hydrogenophaga sp.]|nr:hypothetical protein [Hydrogenophaga sp.]